MIEYVLIDKEMVNYHFDKKELLDIARVHDRLGPRSALAYYLHNDPEKTTELDTSDVEDFIIQFYTQFNSFFGVTY